jgi:hypothetical protein
MRVPGGTLGVWLLGVPPLALMVLAFVRNRSETMSIGRFGETSSLAAGFAIMAVGVVYYFASKLWRKPSTV